MSCSSSGDKRGNLIAYKVGGCKFDPRGDQECLVALGDPQLLQEWDCGLERVRFRPTIPELGPKRPNMVGPVADNAGLNKKALFEGDTEVYCAPQMGPR